MKLVFANINCWKDDLFVQPLPLRSTVPHLSEWFCLNKKTGSTGGIMATLQWNMLGTFPSHVFYPFLQGSGRNLAFCGVDCCACASKKRWSHDFRGKWGFGPYGIQHIENMNKIIKPNTIFSRSSVLGSTSAPAKKLTFFLRIWQERAGWTRRSAIRSVHLCEENHCCLARHYFQKDQTITTPNFNIDITYLKVDPFSKPSFLQSWYLC